VERGLLGELLYDEVQPLHGAVVVLIVADDQTSRPAVDYWVIAAERFIA
jgi:hypothetical protein